MSDRPAPIGACGRAELLWALHAGGSPLLASTADLLGFEKQPIDEQSNQVGADEEMGYDLAPSPPSPAEPPKRTSAQPSPESTAQQTPKSEPERAVTVTPDDQTKPKSSGEPEPDPERLRGRIERSSSIVRDAQFWRLESYQPVAQQAPEPEPERPVEDTQRGWTKWPSVRPVVYPLAPWPELRRRLYLRLTELREGPEPDLERLVGRIGRGRLPERLPRRHRRRLGPALQLVFDRSEHLVPFWSDQDQIAGELARLLAATTLTRAVFHEGLTEPRLLDQAQAGYRPPVTGGVVLVLGDLGGLAGPDTTELWLRIGRRITANGCRPVALIPCRRSRIPKALRRVWHLLIWEHPPGIAEVARASGEWSDDPDVRRNRVRRLLNLLAPAVRIEPGLLRAVRRLLADPAFDAAVESDCWQDPAIAHTHSEAATLDSELVADLRAAFAKETLEVQGRVLKLLRTWRGRLPEEIWYEELLNLAPDCDPDLLDSPELQQDLADARGFFAYQCAQLTQDPMADTPAAAWMRRVTTRATGIWRDKVIGKSLAQLDWAMYRHRPDYRPPIPIDPADLPAPDLPVHRIELSQTGADLSFHRSDRDPPSPGSPLAIIETRNQLVNLTQLRDPAFWETGKPPDWAHTWGWDEYGAWVEFAVASGDGRLVTQRMRWIQPGDFLMGSPENEPGRDSNEGPQRRVRIGHGFWLFDTAVTQALWQAVMGNNPSRFKGPYRPVEPVSWQDCQDFITRLNALKPGLMLTLPSEAQWEYACRAGTQTPFSFGANISSTQVNCFGRKIVSVGSLPANAWGLYEMHGNVEEWVQDTWHVDYEGAPTDGISWESSKPDAYRVIRGGSWISGAHGCRCAYRKGSRPDHRYGFLGFRCARVQGPEPRGREEGMGHANPARPARSGAGRAGSDSTQVADNGSTSSWFRLDDAASERLPLPHTDQIRISTDRQQLALRRITKPNWASAMGRDRFGLWTEITVEHDRGAPVVQRLRWIPPGRFLMGSPPDEPGRWDGEGPRHEVVIGQGYWLFDTPCTQGLWAAVMGENPSEFKTQDRPVENVSWSDVQGFLATLNGRLRDAGDFGGIFVLPSEAQWEYACRAGTETALYTGPIEIRGDADSPALDPIAWYGGNSNQEFELENGQARIWLRELQYPGGVAGTHPVKRKQPNPWGLYDILGNVWEWTQDLWHHSYEQAPSNGSAWESDATGLGRMTRGGSWGGLAGGCRSACRGFGPSVCNNDLGFRCAWIHRKS